MLPVLSDNPTREKIILLLKRGGPLSIEELSRELNITSMGIRQHLLSLERKGLIDYLTKRQGIGRPAFLYKLTEKADALFPKTYDGFALNMLRDIERNSGKEGIDDIFKWHKSRFSRDVREALLDRRTIHEKIYRFADYLESLGYISKISDGNDHYVLKIYNCPLYRIASNYKELCQNNLIAFREVFGKDVARKDCMSEGGTSCTYVIPTKA